MCNCHYALFTSMVKISYLNRNLEVNVRLLIIKRSHCGKTRAAPIYHSFCSPAFSLRVTTKNSPTCSLIKIKSPLGL